MPTPTRTYPKPTTEDGKEGKELHGEEDERENGEVTGETGGQDDGRGDGGVHGQDGRQPAGIVDRERKEREDGRTCPGNGSREGCKCSPPAMC